MGWKRDPGRELILLPGNSSGGVQIDHQALFGLTKSWPASTKWGRVRGLYPPDRDRRLESILRWLPPMDPLEENEAAHLQTEIEIDPAPWEKKKCDGPWSFKLRLTPLTLLEILDLVTDNSRLRFTGRRPDLPGGFRLPPPWSPGSRTARPALEIIRASRMEASAVNRGLEEKGMR